MLWIKYHLRSNYFIVEGIVRKRKTYSNSKHDKLITDKNDRKINRHIIRFTFFRDPKNKICFYRFKVKRDHSVFVVGWTYSKFDRTRPKKFYINKYTCCIIHLVKIECSWILFFHPISILFLCYLHFEI